MPRVKSTRNEEYRKFQVRRGEWQTRVVSVIPETEFVPTGEIADLVRIHLKTNREQE